MDRFTQNQDQNDQRPILHIWSITFYQRKCFVFVVFVYHYPEEPHVAAAAWPCIYLLIHEIFSNICIGLSRYIAITNLSIIAVFVEYLRQLLIDLHQIYRIVVCHKTRLHEFFQLFSSSGFRARRRRDFFVTLCVPRCSESLDCLTLA